MVIWPREGKSIFIITIVSFITIVLNHKKIGLKAVQVDLKSFSGHRER